MSKLVLYQARRQIKNAFNKMKPFYPWLLPGLAVCCLCYGVGYWIRILGLYADQGALWYFNSMPLHWKVLAILLATGYPLAACGLMLRSKSGIFLWLSCALTECIAFTAYKGLFGIFPLHLAFHLVSLPLFFLYFSL